MMRQREPVIVDPNWIADMRQRLVKLDIEMKRINPQFSVYTNPKTKRLANWMAREVGPFTAGYLQSGEQQAEPLGGFQGEYMAFAEGLGGFGLNMLFGTVDLAAKAVKSIAGEEYGLPWAVATNYVEDENGNLVNNGGKVPGFIQTIAAVNARVLGQNVQEYIHRVDAAREFERLQASGFDTLTRGIAGVVGMGFGFGLPAGAAMHTGKALMTGGRIGGGTAGIGKFTVTMPSREFSGLAIKGLQRLAASGASPRMVKLTQVLAGGAGATVANGLAESVAFGRADGYGKAFVHGMLMAPVMLGLGAMGRKTEKLLDRKWMPKSVARGVSGALEGVGFGTLEAAQTGALWKLMSDPSASTWEIYAKNMIGFAIFKGAFGRSVVDTPEFGEAQARQLLRQQGRERLAEEVSRADEGRLYNEADRAIEEQMRAEREMREREAGESEQGLETEPLPDLETRGVPRGTSEATQEAMPPDIRAIQDKDPIWRTKEEKQRLAKWSVESEKRRYEDYVPPKGKTRGEQVEGKEPTVSDPREAKEQIEGRLPSPETQLELGEFFGEQIEGKRVRTEEVLADRTKKKETQGTDPLEDPGFAQRPPEQQKAILERRTAKERRQVAESFEGPERRSGERRRRLSAQDLATEIQRLRAAGPAPENRAQIRRLIESERVSRASGVGESAQQMKRSASEAERTAPEMGESAQDLEARVQESGVPREVLRELGDISRARKAASTPEEAAELFRRQLELEQELDALEMSMDPVMNATMREQLRKMEAEELDMAEAELEAAVKAGEVDPVFGERLGPESMRGPANPYRHQENLLREGEKPIRASDIINVLKGRPGFPGIRILGRRLGRIPGSAVQVAIRAGRIAGRGTAGVFKLYENLTRTKEGMDLVVALHEWSHAMQRQVQFGVGGASLAKWTRKWLKGQTDEVLGDMATILRSYPGAAKLPLWVIGAEAWAEWHARNLLGDPTLRTEVPHLSRVMDAWLRNARSLQPQYREIMELVDVYKRQGSRLRLREATQRGLAREQGSMIERVIGKGDKAWDRVVKAFFDDMHLLKKSQRKWLGLSDVDPTNISILDDPARLYDAVAATAGKQAESLIVRGMHDLRFKRTGESLFDVMNDVGKGLKGREKNEKTIDFIDYVVATRAIDLIGKGKKQTLPLSDYLQAQKELITANPEFAGLSKRLKQWTDGLLDLVAEAGNLPQADVQRMKDYSVVYLPFVRALDGVVTRRGPRGVAEKGNAIKTLKGDTREIADPMQAMFETTTTFVAKAQQYMVTKALYKMMLRADVGGLATRVDRPNVPERYRFDQVVRQLNKALGKSEFMKELQERAAEGDAEAIEILERLQESMDMFGELAKSGELSDDLVTLFGQKLMPFGEGANIIAYTPRLTSKEIDSLPRHAQVEARRWNGKLQWLELDEHAYTALMGLDQPVGPTFLDHPIMHALLVVPKKAVRFFATDANPAFVAANAIRDITSVPVFDREGKVHPVPLWNGLRRFIEGGAVLLGSKNREIADMYEATGARTASIYYESTRREMRGQVATMRERVTEPLLKAAKKWTDWMAQPESFIRVHEFKRVYEQAIKDGRSELEAVYEALEGAKEITVNFARAGAIARAWNQVTPYFSASFAGQRKMLRAITGMEGRTDAERARMQAAAITNGLTGITIPTLASWWMVADEDWYKDLPEWRKRHFVNMRIPTTDTIISLPLPFELGTLFGSMPQILLDHWNGSNPIPVGSTMAGALFPYLRGPGDLLPAGLKPIFELYTGKDFFRGRDLTPFYIEQNNPPEKQVLRSTTEVAQKLFRMIQATGGDVFVDNPIELEQLIAGYTAGASTSFMRWVDEVSGLKDHPGIRPGFESTYSTFLNRFARQTPHGASRAVDEFYNRVAPVIEREYRSSTTKTPAMRRSYRQVQRDKDRMEEIRRQVRSGALSRVEGDRLQYEIARKALEREDR